MPKALPPKLVEVLDKVGLTQKQATWDCHGTPVILHKACEKIAAEYKIVFDTPNMIESDAGSKYAVMCVTGHMGDKTECLLVKLHHITIKTLIRLLWQKSVQKIASY